MYLDGDNRAYLENTQWEMEQNRVKIQQLRMENKQLRASLAKKMAVHQKRQKMNIYQLFKILFVLQADDDVVTKSFKLNNMRPPADLRGITGEVTVTLC